MLGYILGYGFFFTCILISLIAEIKVKITYSKYSKLLSKEGETGYSAARKILDANGLSHIQIEMVRGHLTDHFDPKSSVIRLSESVYNGTSVAALGVAAHECGHAVQYAEEYKPIVFRNAIVKSTNFCSRISFVLIFIGLILSGFATLSNIFVFLGIAAFGMVAFFQLVTLPVEFNASSRALVSLSDHNILNDEELEGTRMVLSAAAMTYVAALIVSVLQLLRLIAIFRDR